MRKFTKRPIEIEAAQWFPGVEVEGVYPPVEGELPRHYVRTAHQQIVFLEPGDWVIAEPDGRGYYPVKPDIFADTYREALPPDALTGILANQVQAQDGRCLCCNEAPALYCGLDCARRGR